MQEKTLTKATSQSSMSGSSDSSWTYDWSGQDAAHKYADESASLDAQRSTALMGDPLSTMPISKRITHLQNYLRAYHTGDNPYGLPVMPARRVASEKHSHSNSTSGSQGVEFGWPKPDSTSSSAP